MQKEQPQAKYSDRVDHHSYSRPNEARVLGVALDLEVLFEERILRGSAVLSIDHIDPSKPLVLDTRDLKITSAEASIDSSTFKATPFRAGAADKVLGAPLTIQLPRSTRQVRISYETSPGATGLQWLTPEQTAAKKYPFLYSQSQAIHARSWIPLQDSPGVRVTYSARIRTPKYVRAVMSAHNDPAAPMNGDYRFDMPQPVPAYLIALAAGDLQYRAISNRTGVYSEPPLLARAAGEFEDMEKMMAAAESLYGAYRWDQYDVLVLPPSFPFGGMENPRLTFATPTLLAGDKSLVGVIAHELAHSWSGNLVTNATWRDFWLNEGFTTYFERRIQEAVYGRARAEMEALLEKQELEREMADLADQDEILYINLQGRDPDDGFTQVPYVKGMLFLRRLEELFGRDRFDAFLKGYFSTFAFRSITTADFLEYLRKNLLDSRPEAAKQIDIDEWLSKPGLPRDTPQPKSEAFDAVAKIAAEWQGGSRSTRSIPIRKWSTPETLLFLTALKNVDAKKMADLDRAFHFTRSGNSEILFQWLLMAIRANYEPAFPKLEEFMVQVGRRKYLRPLYQELVKTPAGKERARAIYGKARPGYHPIAVATVDEILK